MSIEIDGPHLSASLDSGEQAHGGSSHRVTGRRRVRRDATSATLAAMVEREIVPRLFLAHRAPVSQGGPQALIAPLDDLADHERFAELLLSHDANDLVDYLFALLDRGFGPQTLYLEVLAPTARVLGTMWEQDRCTFLDVTIGLTRLHQILQELARRSFNNPVASPQRRAVLAATPGEQHTFGLSILNEMLQSAGWDTSCEASASADQIVSKAAASNVDMIGLTVGNVELLDMLARLIDRLRATTRNRRLVILVGGRACDQNPEIVARLGADGSAPDSAGAVSIADRLVARAVGAPLI